MSTWVSDINMGSNPLPPVYLNSRVPAWAAYSNPLLARPDGNICLLNPQAFQTHPHNGPAAQGQRLYTQFQPVGPNSPYQIQPAETNSPYQIQPVHPVEQCSPYQIQPVEHCSQYQSQEPVVGAPGACPIGYWYRDKSLQEILGETRRDLIESWRRDCESNAPCVQVADETGDGAGLYQPWSTDVDDSHYFQDVHAYPLDVFSPSRLSYANMLSYTLNAALEFSPGKQLSGRELYNVCPSTHELSSECLSTECLSVDECSTEPQSNLNPNASEFIPTAAVASGAVTQRLSGSGSDPKRQHGPPTFNHPPRAIYGRTDQAYFTSSLNTHPLPLIPRGWTSHVHSQSNGIQVSGTGLDSGVQVSGTGLPNGVQVSVRYGHHLSRQLTSVVSSQTSSRATAPPPTTSQLDHHPGIRVLPVQVSQVPVQVCHDSGHRPTSFPATQTTADRTACINSLAGIYRNQMMVSRYQGGQNSSVTGGQLNNGHVSSILSLKQSHAASIHRDWRTANIN